MGGKNNIFLPAKKIRTKRQGSKDIFHRGTKVVQYPSQRSNKAPSAKLTRPCHTSSVHVQCPAHQTNTHHTHQAASSKIHTPPAHTTYHQGLANNT